MFIVYYNMSSIEKIKLSEPGTDKDDKKVDAYLRWKIENFLCNPSL